jgi:transcription factor A
MLRKPKESHSTCNIFVSESVQEGKDGSSLAKLKSKLNLEKIRLVKKQVCIPCGEDDKIYYDNEMKSWEEQMSKVSG